MVPDRRTLIVLGCLIAGMTLSSGVLLLLEPGPVAPFSGVTLQSIDRASEPDRRLFETAPDRPWEAIVIHDTGSMTGSAASLNALHKQMGRGGLGYHFVINNGSADTDDGMIELGFRWEHQLPGNYLEGEDASVAWFHENAIGVSVVGDLSRRQLSEPQLRELIWLVKQLQRAYEIPRDRVFVQVGSMDEPAEHFPLAWFRQQLPSVARN